MLWLVNQINGGKRITYTTTLEANRIHDMSGPLHIHCEWGILCMFCFLIRLARKVAEYPVSYVDLPMFVVMDDPCFDRLAVQSGVEANVRSMCVV